MAPRVTRVLVMVEREGEPRSEVFELVGLVTELHEQKVTFPEVYLHVRARNDYGRTMPDGRFAAQVEATWSGLTTRLASSPYLQDIINATLPDSAAVKRLRRQAKRAADEAFRLNAEADRAKIRQVSGLRRLGSVATVTSSTPLDAARGAVAG